MGTQILLPKKGAQPSIFVVRLGFVCCGQTAGWIKIPLGVMVGRDPGNIVLDADPTPPHKGHSPQILAHVCCGQTARWINMSLRTKVGLGLGRIVLHGDPAPPSQKGHSRQFSANVHCGQTVAHLSYCRALVAQLTT